MLRLAILCFLKNLIARSYFRALKQENLISESTNSLQFCFPESATSIPTRFWKSTVLSSGEDGRGFSSVLPGANALRLTRLHFANVNYTVPVMYSICPSSSHSRHFQENSEFTFASRREQQGGVLGTGARRRPRRVGPDSQDRLTVLGRRANGGLGRGPQRSERQRPRLGEQTVTLSSGRRRPPQGGRADGRRPQLGEWTAASAGQADDGPDRAGGRRPRPVSRRWPRQGGRTGGLSRVGAAHFYLQMREGVDFCFASLLPCKKHRLFASSDRTPSRKEQ
jgi:hypothetical protein